MTSKLQGMTLASYTFLCLEELSMEVKLYFGRLWKIEQEHKVASFYFETFLCIIITTEAVASPFFAILTSF